MEDQNQDMEQSQGLEEFYRLEQAPKSDKKRRKGSKKWLIVILCIIAFTVIVGLTISWLFSDSLPDTPQESYIGVLYVEGIITRDNEDSWGRAMSYQHDFTISSIDQLISDENNKGIILYIDTPGGGVYESDELYFKIKEYQEETDRPVYAYMASMATSGGYYISAPADMIFANRNCWTGSIGVTIGTFYDISGFLENHGIHTTTITGGKNKAMGSMVEPLTPEQQDILQTLVNEAHDQFIGIVAEERQMEFDRVRELADGRIYTARQALNLGLIDAVGPYEAAIQHMTDTYELEGSLLYDICYQDNSFIGRLFNKLPLFQRSGSDAEIVLSMIRNDVNFPISYLCEMLR